MSKLAIHSGPQAAEGLREFAWPKLRPEDEAAVLKALRDNYWGGIGDENLPNTLFEKGFAEYHDARYGVAVANGTVSLELSLRAGGVRPGDEVLVPAITFVATASAIVSVGAVPVFVDVDPRTAQIDAVALEAAVTPRTRAVIAVHYGGYMADMDAVLPAAMRHHLLVVEDCAHAQGSAWRGKGAGSLGHFGSFSFQHSKSLVAGEGGIVLTDDEALFEKVALMRNIGRRTGQASYDHYISASNCRMGGLQGALLLSQFSRFSQQAEERHRNGLWLEGELDNIPGLSRQPADERLTRRGCYFLVLNFDAEAFGCSRDRFISAMQAEGVGWVGAGYARPLYREPAFLPDNLKPLLPPGIPVPDYPSLRLPHSEKWAACQVTIGHPYLLGDGAGARLVLEAARKVKECVKDLQ
ncbi:MAG: DegT/DnrJ/EryC1/StrS family aminotransferase [Armatimonadetes bacterium]|nr:DegT/DnrJ/EryC1/StrS family aminotransferase [Armatimonadota bacterium]